jgi:hypothetical protein
MLAPISSVHDFFGIFDIILTPSLSPAPQVKGFHRIKLTSKNGEGPTPAMNDAQKTVHNQIDRNNQI